MIKIHQIEPWIDAHELRELKRVVRSNYVMENELTAEFEKRISHLTGSKYSIAMVNATSALFCSLRALGIGPGDEVIVPDLTFVATSNAVILAGAKPIFCDVDPRTFCLDPKSAEQKINRRTKAILPVHLYGQSADMVKILQLAKKFRITVLEDAAQGVGVRFKGRHVGTFGNAGVLSFCGNKTITCGQGGVILTQNRKIADACFRLKNHGRIGKGTFVHEEVGFNFSFTEMQAAVGIAQLKKLKRIVERKRQIHQKYLDAFANLSPQIKPMYVDPDCEPVFWFSSFLVTDLEALGRYLDTQGIQTRRFFYPLHLQPCYQNSKWRARGGRFDNSKRAYDHGLSLPSSYSLKESEQTLVVKAIHRFYGGKR